MNSSGFKYQPGYGGAWLPYVNLEGQWPTYSAVLSQVALPNGAFFVLTAATGTALTKITRIKIGPSIATAAAVQFIQLVSWSAGPTGGGAGSAVTPGRVNAGNGAATAVATNYVGGVPTGQTTLYTVRSEQLIGSPATPTFTGNTILWEFGKGVSQLATITAGQFLALTCNATAAGQKVDLEVEWCECPIGGGEV